MLWFSSMRWSSPRRGSPRLRGIASISNAMKLRPYQEACLSACVDALNSGTTRVGVSLPTGAGKTTVFVSLLARIPPPLYNPDAKRSLIVVNSIELANQAASQVKMLFPDWAVEIEQGVKHKASGLADVTIATYQTLMRPSRIAKFHHRFLKAIIVDEAHHAAAPSYRRLLSHFHSDVKHPDLSFIPPIFEHTVPIIGFSATFNRHDGLALGSVFERIVYHRDFLEMIKEKWLCNVKFTSVRTDINLKDVTINTSSGDFNATSLAHVVNTDTVNTLVVRTWLDRAATRRSTLVFCVNVAHVKQLTKVFMEHGVDARYLYSKTPMGEREILLRQFKAGSFPVLINCAILTEGTDIPNIDCVVVARPTRSRNLFAQMIGRGMRQSPETGKIDCRVIDFVESLDRVAGVVSIPTLFGLDPSVVIDDETLESLEDRATELIADDDPLSSDEESLLKVPLPKSVTYVDYEDPFALVHHASGAPNIYKLSRFAWVGCGEDVYVLDCLGKGVIRIEMIEEDDIECEDRKTGSRYQAEFTPTVDIATAKALGIPPFLRSRQILKANSLADAIRGCDTYAMTKVVQGPLLSGMFRSARWRKLPATDNQKAFVAKRLSRSILSAADLEHGKPRSRNNLDIEVLTKGQAANIITRLKHGAKGRYDKKIKKDERTAKQQEKERLRQARQKVEVGPLPVDDNAIFHVP